MPDVEQGTPLASTEEQREPFVLVEGGLLLQLLERRGYTKFAKRLRRLRLLLLPLVTWAPLLFLSQLQGVALGDQVPVPFLYDFSPHVRFWVAMPLLLWAEEIINPALTHVIRHMREPGFIEKESIPRFEAALARLQASRRSLAVGPFALALAYFFVFLGPSAMAPETSWRAGSPPANDWYIWVSMPLYQFLIVRWLWWFWGWTRLLRTLASLKLRLIAMHPDQLAGLGLVNVAHVRFAAVVFATSIGVSAEIGHRLVFYHLRLTQMTATIIAFVVVAVVWIAWPLLLFSMKLINTKYHSLLDFGAFAHKYTHAFQEKWVVDESRTGEEALGTSDIQSLSDLHNSFMTVRKMSIVMWVPEVIAPLVAAAVIPMLPLLLTEVSMAEIARGLLKALS